MKIYHNQFVRFGDGEVCHPADNWKTYCGKNLGASAYRHNLHINDEKNIKCKKCGKSSPLGFNVPSEVRTKLINTYFLGDIK